MSQCYLLTSNCVARCVRETMKNVTTKPTKMFIFFLDKVKNIWCCYNFFPTFIGLLNKVRKNLTTKMQEMFLWMQLFTVLRSTCLVSYFLNQIIFICSQSGYQLLPCQKNLFFLYKLPFGFGSHAWGRKSLLHQEKAAANNDALIMKYWVR